MIVDDDDALASALKAVLELEGFNVRIADCLHCVELARQWPPGVVLLDIEMPIIDGFRIAQQLRRLTNLAPVPIIAHTSLPEAEVAIKGISAGFDAYCRKGNSPAALIALIRRVVTACPAASSHHPMVIQPSSTP